MRPELLERTDLAPAMAKDAQSHTFMGVKLALTELDTPDYACLLYTSPSPRD